MPRDPTMNGPTINARMRDSMCINAMNESIILNIWNAFRKPLLVLLWEHAFQYDICQAEDIDGCGGQKGWQHNVRKLAYSEATQQ